MQKRNVVAARPKFTPVVEFSDPEGISSVSQKFFSASFRNGPTAKDNISHKKTSKAVYDSMKDTDLMIPIRLCYSSCTAKVAKVVKDTLGMGKVSAVDDNVTELQYRGGNSFVIVSSKDGIQHEHQFNFICLGLNKSAECTIYGFLTKGINGQPACIEFSGQKHTLPQLEVVNGADQKYAVYTAFGISTTGSGPPKFDQTNVSQEEFYDQEKGYIELLKKDAKVEKERAEEAVEPEIVPNSQEASSGSFFMSLDPEDETFVAPKMKASDSSTRNPVAGLAPSSKTTRRTAATNRATTAPKEQVIVEPPAPVQESAPRDLPPPATGTASASTHPASVSSSLDLFDQGFDEGTERSNTPPAVHPQTASSGPALNNASGTTSSVTISSLESSELLRKVDAALVKRMVAEYKKDPASLAPSDSLIFGIVDPDGRMLVTDGQHRITAWKQLIDHKHMPADSTVSLSTTRVSAQAFKAAMGYKTGNIKEIVNEELLTCIRAVLKMELKKKNLPDCERISHIYRIENSGNVSVKQKHRFRHKVRQHLVQEYGIELYAKLNLELANALLLDKDDFYLCLSLAEAARTFHKDRESQQLTTNERVWTFLKTHLNRPLRNAFRKEVQQYIDNPSDLLSWLADMKKRGYCSAKKTTASTQPVGLKMEAKKEVRMVQEPQATLDSDGDSDSVLQRCSSEALPRTTTSEAVSLKNVDPARKSSTRAPKRAKSPSDSDDEIISKRAAKESQVIVETAPLRVQSNNVQNAQEFQRPSEDSFDAPVAFASTGPTGIGQFDEDMTFDSGRAEDQQDHNGARDEPAPPAETVPSPNWKATSSAEFTQLVNERLEDSGDKDYIVICATEKEDIGGLLEIYKKRDRVMLVIAGGDAVRPVIQTLDLDKTCVVECAVPTGKTPPPNPMNTVAILTMIAKKNENSSFLQCTMMEFKNKLYPSHVDLLTARVQNFPHGSSILWPGEPRPIIREKAAAKGIRLLF